MAPFCASGGRAAQRADVSQRMRHESGGAEARLERAHVGRV